MARTRKVEDQPLSPKQVTGAMFTVAMQRLMRNEDFQLLRSQWMNLRAAVLEAGKKAPSEGQWFVLKGFDLAVMEPDTWAAKVDRGNAMKERQEELMKILGGE